MAKESQEAAWYLEAGHLRSSASRYYYAAFQSVTAVLLYLGLTPPENEEGWSHAATPDMIRDHWETLVRSRDERTLIAFRLGELYKLRILADYVGGSRIERTKLREAAKNARYIVKLALSVMPEEQ